MTFVFVFALVLAACKRTPKDNAQPVDTPLGEGLLVAGNVASFAITRTHIAWLERGDPGRIFVRERARGGASSDRELATVPGSEDERAQAALAATSTHVFWYAPNALMAAPIAAGAGGPRVLAEEYGALDREILPWEGGVVVERRDLALVHLDAGGAERRIILPPPPRRDGKRFWSIFAMPGRLCWSKIGINGDDKGIECTTPEGPIEKKRNTGVLVGATDEILTFQDEGHLYVLRKDGSEKEPTPRGDWPRNVSNHRSNGKHSCITQGMQFRGTETILCLSKSGAFETELTGAPWLAKIEIFGGSLVYVATDGVRARPLR